MKKQITLKSKIRDIAENPVGSDVVARLLGGLGMDTSAVRNPIIGGIKLKSLPKLTRGAIDSSVIDTLIRMLNSSDDAVEPRLDGAYEEKWWKDAVVYQIYPRSFMDGNGDGMGDLRGVIERLDYLSELGVTALWLTPVCDSPNDDNGYDIRDYRAIMREFGTMEDYEELLEKAHARGMRVIMDMVLNHSSDEHEWFQKALAGEEKYKGYYFFRSGSPESPPNNWLSFFSGSAWNYYPEPGEWALHTFSKKQMDLNWNNPDLRAELCDILNFWIDKGVDGFRLDVINFIGKDESLPDGSEAIGKMLGYRGVEHYFFTPQLHERLREMREKATGRGDCFTVGEAAGTGLCMSRLITDSRRRELDTVFNFDHLTNPGKSKYDEGAYDLGWMKKCFTEQQLSYGRDCWNTLFFENHDNPRMISKIDTRPEHRDAVGKLLAVVLMTLCGTPFIYQGQELGMINTAFAPEELRDVEAINLLAELEEKMSREEAMRIINAGSRDHARVPMQWDGTEGVGFTTGRPWIKPGERSERYNAEAEAADEHSVLNAYRALIALRKAEHALRYGEFIPLKKCPKELFCYSREEGGRRFYCEINLTDRPQKRPKLPKGARCVFASLGAAERKLRAYEANIYLVEK